MQQTQPFEVTGVDYTGALYVRNAGIEIKVYTCLFTCATTRAIHLEVVEDLTVETFLLAFCRFASRKSRPRKLISDVEAILNDRPLTYVSLDVKDEEALTPAHLLYGQRIMSLPHPLVESDKVNDPTY